MSITSTTAEQDAEQIEALSGRVFMAGLEALELVNVELGLRLGLYSALAERGALTSSELAAAAGIAERYAREWLEQQAVTGILDVEGETADGQARRYVLSGAHAHVLLDPDSPANTTAIAAFLVECARMVPALVDAFRSGGGVAYADFAIHDLQAAFTRPVFANNLLQDWLPALPDVHARLSAGDPLRIGDRVRRGDRVDHDRPCLSQRGRPRLRPRRGVDRRGAQERGGSESG